MPPVCPRQRSEPTLRQRIDAQLDRLVSWASLPGAPAAALHELVELFGREALDRPAREPYDGLSRINANGLPFQWSVQLGAGQERTVRFLCEAGVPGSSAEERCELTVRRLREACGLLRIAWPDWLEERLFPRVLPRPGRWPGSWRSGMWIAAGAGPRGALVKPYLNLNWGPPVERWRRIGWVLKELGRERSLASLCQLSGKVARDSWPAGLALDLLADGSAGRIKAYFRSGAVTTRWLERWYEAVGCGDASAAIRSFLDAYPWAGGATYPEGAFVVSLEFHPHTEMATLKTDLSVTKWVASDRECVERTRSLLAALEIDEEPYLGALEAIGAVPSDPRECSAHRFVSLGLEPDGGRHVNVYFEPPGGASLPPRRRTGSLRREPALAAAGEFLRRAQRPEGCWVDFELPVGKSDSWVTAYVLVQLGGGVAAGREALGGRALERALDWLAESQSRGGGWGYHRGLEADADSTGLAVLALECHGRTVPAGARGILRRLVRADGGVATYRGGAEGGTEGSGAWLASTADVTPIAQAALAERAGSRLHRAAARYLLALRRPDGLWPSYWWLSPLYPTWVSLLWLGSAAAHPELAGTLAAYRPAGAFELALLLLCRQSAGLSGAGSSTLLLEQQRRDGSWTGSPILRLTHPGVYDPARAIDAGPVYADVESIFTTATAYRALTAIGAAPAGRCR